MTKRDKTPTSIISHPAENYHQTLKNWAEFYVIQGLQIVPCKGKDRLISEPIDTPEKARAWWEKHPTHNIGIVAGENIAILDVDDPDILLDKDIPLTWTTRTPSGLYHFYFWCKSETKGYKMMDEHSKEIFSLRTGNSYCIAPPSNHELTPITGSYYQWISGREPWTIPLADLPTWLKKPFENKNKKTKPILRQSIKYLNSVVDNQLFGSSFLKTRLAFELLTSVDTTGWRVGKAICCLLHPEKRPSLALYRMSDGTLGFADFHTRAFKEGENKKIAIVAPVGVFLSRYLFGESANRKKTAFFLHRLTLFIEDWIGEGDSYRRIHWLKEIVGKTNLSENERVVVERAALIVSAFSGNGQEFKLSCRDLGRALRISKDLASRLMNFLCCLGFVEKLPRTESVELHADSYRPGKMIGFGDWITVSTFNITGKQAARLFGYDRALAIYRRIPPKKGLRVAQKLSETAKPETKRKPPEPLPKREPVQSHVVDLSQTFVVEPAILEAIFGEVCVVGYKRESKGSGVKT